VLPSVSRSQSQPQTVQVPQCRHPDVPQCGVIGSNGSQTSLYCEDITLADGTGGTSPSSATNRPLGSEVGTLSAADISGPGARSSSVALQTDRDVELEQLVPVASTCPAAGTRCTCGGDAPDRGYRVINRGHPIPKRVARVAVHPVRCVTTNLIASANSHITCGSMMRTCPPEKKLPMTPAPPVLIDCTSGQRNCSLENVLLTRCDVCCSRLA
jgi:hypothetical protein